MVLCDDGLISCISTFLFFQADSFISRHLNHHEGHDGFELAVNVSNTCRAEHHGLKQSSVKALFAIPSKRLAYCPIEKSGTTYWRRFFYMLHVNLTSYQNPYDVPIGTALGKSVLFKKKISSTKQADILFQNYFSFIIVRDPYSRLLSAFVDKLLPPNPTYWKGFGIKAIKAYRKDNKAGEVDGHDVTFEEFVRHVVDSESMGRNLDVHFMSIMRSCRPCQYKFDYVGKMEAFQEHAVFIMDKAGVNTSVDSIKNKFSQLSVDDAILDSIRSPFSWKKDVLKSISWDKALYRIWLKLQMRGIISMDKKLELTTQNVNMSVDDFIELARKAHKQSDPVELKKTKEIAKREAFATVPVDVIKAFRAVFRDDFRYFSYDDSPSYIFHRPERSQNILFNYSYLN